MPDKSQLTGNDSMYYICQNDFINQQADVVECWCEPDEKPGIECKAPKNIFWKLN